MLTEDDQLIVIALADRIILDRLTPFDEKAEVHLQFHKQLAERITKLEKRLENSENQDISKT